jgi:hypothetical protein
VRGTVAPQRFTCGDGTVVVHCSDGTVDVRCCSAKAPRLGLAEEKKTKL